MSIAYLEHGENSRHILFDEAAPHIFTVHKAKCLKVDFDVLNVGNLNEVRICDPLLL